MHNVSRCALFTLVLIYCMIGFVQAGNDASLPETYVGGSSSIATWEARSVTPPLISAFGAPDKDTRGLAYDGQFLWAANSGDDSSAYGPKIYKLDPDSGTVINAYDGIANYPCGLAWDGQYLWHSAFVAGMIYKLDTATMSVDTSFAAPTTQPFDMAWDGTYLYAVRGNEPMISVIDTSTGVEIDSIEVTYSSPNVRPFGLTCVVRNAPQLWTSDGNYGSNFVNLWDPFTSSWIDQWPADPATYPAGLAYDSVGERLWVSCYNRDSIYIYDVSQVGITVDESIHVSGLRIEARPNPFTNTTKIRYTIQDTGYMIERGNQNIGGTVGGLSDYQKPELKIYDALGRLVKSFDLESGILNRVSWVSWDGCDDSGSTLPPGVYFLENSGSDSAVKLVKLK